MDDGMPKQTFSSSSMNEINDFLKVLFAKNSISILNFGDIYSKNAKGETIHRNLFKFPDSGSFLSIDRCFDKYDAGLNFSYSVLIPNKHSFNGLISSLKNYSSNVARFSDNLSTDDLILVPSREHSLNGSSSYFLAQSKVPLYKPQDGLFLENIVLPFEDELNSFYKLKS